VGHVKKNIWKVLENRNDGPDLKNILVPGEAGPWWSGLAGLYNGINELDDPIIPYFFGRGGS
jgi:hypothetical protein